MPRALTGLLFAALLAGCAGTDEAAPPAPEPEGIAGVDSAAEARARELQTAGEHEAALKAFRELASQSGGERSRRAEFLFLAAESALALEEFNQAYELFVSFIRRFPDSPRYPEAIERVFIIGRAFCEGRATKPSWLLGISMTDREFGVELLTAFQQAREQHPLADDALHHVAEAQLALNEHELAIATWEKLGALYPDRELVDTAEFRSAQAFIEMSRGVEYDKRPLHTALSRLRRYVKSHPTGSHFQEAQEEIRGLEELLGGHELDVAAFYRRRDRNYAARLYQESVLRDYPGTEAAAEAQRERDRLPATSPPPPPPEPADEGYLRLGEPLPPELPEPVPID